MLLFFTFALGANMLLDSSLKNLRLADFGAAARFSEQAKFSKMAGTPSFMAPEVVRCKPPYTAKCDVWSMGCAMIEMAFGHPPWLNGREQSSYSRFEILYKVCKHSECDSEITYFYFIFPL